MKNLFFIDTIFTNDKLNEGCEQVNFNYML